MAISARLSGFKVRCSGPYLGFLVWRGGGGGGGGGGVGETPYTPPAEVSRKQTGFLVGSFCFHPYTESFADFNECNSVNTGRTCYVSSSKHRILSKSYQ